MDLEQEKDQTVDRATALAKTIMNESDTPFEALALVSLTLGMMVGFVKDYFPQDWNEIEGDIRNIWEGPDQGRRYDA